jgi:hypothetical protein
VDLAIRASKGDAEAKASFEEYRRSEERAGERASKKAEWILGEARRQVQAAEGRLGQVTRTPEEFDAQVAERALKMAEGAGDPDVLDIVRWSVGAGAPSGSLPGRRRTPTPAPAPGRRLPGRAGGGAAAAPSREDPLGLRQFLPR